MDTDLARLVVSLEVRDKQLLNALNKVNGTVNQRTRAIESRFKAMGSRASKSLDSLRGGVALVGGALGVREIVSYADAWTQAGNKIKAAAQIAGVQVRSLSEINDIAARTRSGLAETADLFARLVRSASGFVKSEEEVARITEIINKSFKAGGAAASEQAAGVLQLSQALGSGFLQGDELRSIRENAPLLAAAIAKEFGTTVAGLKKLGADGEITTDRIVKGILGGAAEIEGAFDQTNATIGDGFTNLKNKLTEYIGTQSEAIGLTETLNNVLGTLAGNIGSVANAAAAAGVVLAGAFGSRLLLGGVALLANPFVAAAAVIGAAAFALSEFGDKINPIAGDIANLQDFSAVLWDSLKDGAATTSGVISTAFSAVIDFISSALGGVEINFQSVVSFIVGAADKILNAFTLVFDGLVATFTKLPNAIAEAVLSAMNGMIGLVESALQKVIDAVNTTIRAVNSIGGFAGIGSAFSEIGAVDLGRLENSFAGAGAAAANAYADALKNVGKTRIAEALSSVNNQIAVFGEDIRQRANQRARARNDTEENGPQTVALPGKGFGKGGVPPPARKKTGEKNEFAAEIEQIKERTAALIAETAAQAGLNPLVEDYGFAVTRAAAAADLFTAAQKGGTAAGKELASVGQLLSGDFSGLSVAARDQAIAMLSLADGYANATVEANKLSESQDRIREANDEIKDLGKDVFGGFITDIRNGTSAVDALSNALDKIADKLLDIALNSVFDNLLGGTSGGSSLLSLFGFKDGGIVRNGRPISGGTPLPRFAGGGVSKTASIFGEAGPEAAVPLPDGRRIPVDLRLPRPPRQSGGANGPIVIRVVGEEGETFSARVQEISGQVAGVVVQASAPGVIERSTAASGRALSSGGFDEGMSKFGLSRQAKRR